MTAWIVGAGLAGAACAFELRRHDVHCHLFEREDRWGGLVRSTRTDGVIHEPNGTHVFHTDDEEVWNLVTALVPFNGYEHRVQTMVRDELLTWPIQEQEIRRTYGDRVADQLYPDYEPSAPEGLNFEKWCLLIMPREVYDDFVRPYTEKQWGRPASELSASFAPKRVQVRTDGNDRLFRDRFQGFPDGRLEFSYEDMLRELIGSAKVHLDVRCTLASTAALLRSYPAPWRPDFVVITAPLDDFCDGALGELEWRGLTFAHRWIDVPEDGFAQQRTVVNYPGKDFPWIRIHETKRASGQVVRGTVLTTEFPGGPGRMYPVPGHDGRNRKLNDDYKQLVRETIEALGPRVAFVGRLAHHVYADQDDVIRQALDAVRGLVAGEIVETMAAMGA